MEYSLEDTHSYHMPVRNIRLRTPGPHNCTLFVPFCSRIGWAEFGAYSVIENKGIEKLNFERYFICLAPAIQQWPNQWNKVNQPLPRPSPHPTTFGVGAGRGRLVGTS